MNPQSSEDYQKSEREIESDFDYRAREVASNQRFMRKPKTSAALISKVIAKRGFAETRSKAQLDQFWIEVVGENIAQRTRVGSVRRGVLEVFVESSSAKQHYHMMKANWLQEFTKKFPGVGVKDIRFKLGS